MAVGTKGPSRELDCYVFPFDLPALGAVTVARNIRIATNFRVYKITGHSTGRYVAQIIDGITRRFLFPAPIRDDDFVGTGELPFVLPMTYTFQEKGTIEIIFTDVSGAPNPGMLILWGECYLSGTELAGQVGNITMT